MHACTHARMHARTHAHMHAHTHTLTLNHCYWLGGNESISQPYAGVKERHKRSIKTVCVHSLVKLDVITLLPELPNLPLWREISRFYTLQGEAPSLPLLKQILPLSYAFTLSI